MYIIDASLEPHKMNKSHSSCYLLYLLFLDCFGEFDILRMFFTDGTFWVYVPNTR